jgi:uncharacterized protein (TIGR03435 family)
MAQFANTLASMAHRPVVDQTGVTGTFRLYMEYSPDDMAWTFSPLPCKSGPDVNPPSVHPGPDIFTAIQEQLGLKLIEGSKVPHQYLVIDRAERPSEN